MNTKQLLFFKRTAELENMTKAAEDLMVSQPFLSRILSELQSELGIKLFDHVGRNIVLNVYGKTFYKRVVNIFNEVDDAVMEVRDLYQLQLSKVSVVTNVSLYMPDLLKLITLDHSNLAISLYSAKNNKIREMVLDGSADFGICCPPIEPCDDLNSIDLHYESGVLIYPKNHWLEKFQEVDFKDIQSETIISVSKGYGTRAILDEYVQNEKLNFPKILIETTDTSSIFKYVENGLGIALVPISQALSQPSFRNKYVKLKNGIGGKVTLIWRRGQYISNARDLFIEKTKEYFNNLET